MLLINNFFEPQRHKRYRGAQRFYKSLQGAFYQFRYNISDLLHFDAPNQLTVKVSKMSADASVNNAERLTDCWIFSGIFRPVYLEAFPTQYIEHTAINAKANGAFSIMIMP